MPTILAMVDAIHQKELHLNAQKREVGKSLRVARKTRGLTLGEVGKKVRLSLSQVHNIEKGKAWKYRTVARIARFYDRHAA